MVEDICHHWPAHEAINFGLEDAEDDSYAWRERKANMNRQDRIDLQEMKWSLVEEVRQARSNRRYLNGTDLAALHREGLLTKEEVRNYLRSYYWQDSPGGLR